MSEPSYPPPSATPFWVNHLAMALVFGMLWLLYRNDFVYNGNGIFRESSDLIFLLSLLLYAVPIFIYETLILKVWRRPSAALDFENSSEPKRDYMRVLVKLWGLGGTIATLGFLYWLFPEYGKDLYQLFFRLTTQWLPYTVPFAILYFVWMDGHQREPKDEYWHAGLFFLGRWEQMDKARLAHHARAWAIKGFFLPMMLNYLYGNYTYVLGFQPGEELRFYPTFDLIVTLLYIADLMPACVGYILNMRLFDNHIRSADPTVKGWLVCLMCYAPIWHVLMYDNYLPYMNGDNWSHWLGESDWRWLWAGMILLSLMLYSSASVCFGARWSNLTYRGLISTGPYRLTKHPAYVFKNISWWLISVPFIVEAGWAEALKQVCMILLVNFIYYQRAVTEERHLSRFEEYREYALWMNNHSIFRLLGKYLPTLRYSPAKYGY